MALIRILGASILLAAGVAAEAQSPSPQKTQLPGTVITVDANLGQFSMKTDQGDTVTVVAGPKTVIIQMPAGETDIKKGSKLQLSGIEAGDRVVAFVRPGVPVIASSLVVRSKADVDSMRAKAQEEWKTRGSAGTVTGVDPAAHTITVQSGRQTLTIHTGDGTKFRRYAADSPKSADAHASTFADIRTGDRIHVLGNRSADNSVQAEVVYSGAFRQMAATIDAVDTATGELKVTDLATKKPLSIRITPDSVLKRMPEQMAQSLARRYRNGRQGAGAGAGASPPLDQLPAAQLAELKPKDAIMVSTTMGSEPGTVTAIMLLAGVEPLLTASPTAAQDIMSGWNLGEGGDGESDQ